jgi:hypothetical protein
MKNIYNSSSERNRVGAAWSAYLLLAYHTLTARKPARSRLALGLTLTARKPARSRLALGLFPSALPFSLECGYYDIKQLFRLHR